VGDNINGQIFDAISEDTNVDSPTRIALIGRRTKIISDNLIYSTALAQERSDYELQNYISLMESVDLSTIVIDIIEGDDIVTIIDSGNGLIGDRYLVKSVSFPLANGQDMKLSVWKARSLS
jgi:hypothetical protein